MTIAIKPKQPNSLLPVATPSDTACRSSASPKRKLPGDVVVAVKGLFLTAIPSLTNRLFRSYIYRTIKIYELVTSRLHEDA
jgi:hypothetical protein